MRWFAAALVGMVLLVSGGARSDESHEFIVRFKTDTRIEDLFGFQGAFLKMRSTRILLDGKSFVLSGDLNAIRANPSVEWVEPNYRLQAGPVTREIPDGAWGVKKIKADQVWPDFTGKNVVVAVIDTGVDAKHPELAGKIFVNKGEIPDNGIDDDGDGFIDDVSGWNFSAKTNDPNDDNDHGTHVSGTIAGETVGVAPGVTILPIKFLDKDGGGSLADAVDAIRYAILMKADVMSNSWGGGGYSQAMYDAISAANDAGIWFIAAAGNDASNNDKKPAYPASYDLPNVISVLATDVNDMKASFSNWGDKTVHVGAPGVGILSSIPGGGYDSYSGTSMATPHVSGVAALMIEKNSRVNIRKALIKSSDSFPLKDVAKGRVNAYKGVSALRHLP